MTTLLWILGYLIVGFGVAVLLARYHSEFSRDEGPAAIGAIVLWPVGLIFWATSTEAIPTLINRIARRLPDRQAGKMVPNVLIERELALLTERVMAMGNQEPVAFDLDQFRKKQYDRCPECGSTATSHFCPGKSGMEPKAWTSREADETPVGADGVATEEDMG